MSIREHRKLSINPAFFQEIKEDQAELKSILDRLKELTGDPRRLADDHPGFIQSLADFRDQLAFHFALEEAYGYFDEALDVAPRLHRESQRLRSQHAELYEQAQKLAEEADERPVTNFEVLSRKTDELLTGLANHEAAELALILSAMHDDIGDGD